MLTFKLAKLKSKGRTIASCRPFGNEGGFARKINLHNSLCDIISRRALAPTPRYAFFLHMIAKGIFFFFNFISHSWSEPLVFLKVYLRRSLLSFRYARHRVAKSVFFKKLSLTHLKCNLADTWGHTYGCHETPKGCPRDGPFKKYTIRCWSSARGCSEAKTRQ